MRSLLGVSWTVISRVISRVAIVITHIRGLIAPVIIITTPEPPSGMARPRNVFVQAFPAFILTTALLAP